MLRLILTALLFVAGLFSLFMGVGFLLDPAGSGADFGLAPPDEAGLATIRADISAFFLVAGGCMIWGAWRRKGDPLLVSAALFGIAFIGRAVNVLAIGSHDGFWLPMLLEALAVILCLIGSRALPHRVLASGLHR